MPRRLLAAASAIAMGAAIWAAGPALAGDNDTKPITIDPTEGPPGTAITVTGEGCVDDGPTEVFVDLRIPGGSDRMDTATVDTEVDGSWTAEVTVPADTTLYGAWPVGATCQAKLESVDGAQAAQDPELFEYESADFTVLAPAAPPATPPTTAPPAAPVEQEAPFTG